MHEDPLKEIHEVLKLLRHSVDACSTALTRIGMEVTAIRDTVTSVHTATGAVQSEDFWRVCSGDLLL